MDSDNFAGSVIDNELEHAVGLRLGEGVLHGTEAGLVDSDILELFRGFFFRVSDSCDLGSGENGLGDILVVDRTVHTSKDSIGQAVTFHQGDGCQGNAVGDIADGENAWDVGTGVFIDGNEGVFGVDTGGIQVEVFNLTLAASGVHNGVALNPVSTLIDDGEASIVVLDNFSRIGVELQVDAGVVFHLFLQVRAHIVIESTEEQVTTVHEGDISAQTVHDGGEFQSNESTSNNHHALGLFI
mmetsp:Transcript_2526/g.6023  ORF Transcript_2526/g.6023 Transcript_2526/m.6023 type:complete len:241 (-) Transcript_2526:726-1448(-)